jgi:hypothetical protein
MLYVGPSWLCVGLSWGYVAPSWGYVEGRKDIKVQKLYEHMFPSQFVDFLIDFLSYICGDTQLEQSVAH